MAGGQHQTQTHDNNVQGSLVAPTPRGIAGKPRRAGAVPGTAGGRSGGGGGAVSPMTPGTPAESGLGPTPTEPGGGGGGVFVESLDGRSSTAPDAGKARAALRARKAGPGSGRAGGPSHFDAEMEANRLAYVRHLQVCTGSMVSCIAARGGIGGGVGHRT